MSCVLAEGALVQHKIWKLQLSSLAHVYLFSLSWEYCMSVVDFLCIQVVQGNFKGKKTPTLQTSQRTFFSSFLIISAFLHHRRSTKNVIQLEVLGNWEMLATSKSLSCDLCRWVLCYTCSATFYFKIKQVSCS